MPLAYLAYEVYIKGDDRSVIISASSSDKIAFSLGKYSEEFFLVIKSTSPSDLISKLKEEIKTNLPQLSPAKIIDHSNNSDFKQIRFELNGDLEAQLSNIYRKFVSSYTEDRNRE